MGRMDRMDRKKAGRWERSKREEQREKEEAGAELMVGTGVVVLGEHKHLCASVKFREGAFVSPARALPSFMHQAAAERRSARS